MSTPTRHEAGDGAKPQPNGEVPRDYPMVTPGVTSRGDDPSGGLGLDSGFRDGPDVNDPYKMLWANSPERAWFVKRNRPWPLAASVVLLTFATVLLATRWRGGGMNENWRDVLWIIAVLSAAALAWSVAPYISARWSLWERRKREAQYQAEAALQALSGSMDGTIPLSRLYIMNRRQLDAYQEMTKRQQRSSFRMAQVSSAVGFIILVSGAIIALNGPGDSAWLTAGLTALGTAISAFLGATFLDSHKKTNAQLNKFANEPHITGRMLSAERVAMLQAWPRTSAPARLLLQALLTPPERLDGDQEEETEQEAVPEDQPDDTGQADAAQQ
ncbi:ABC transporter ATP-binding protein [Blastococcus sp. CT_GayMR16]|uniref:TRADD-N-associated membrane domain-containing protein n=1 Tax=Blastococcus sp. CT_GayMR16 TaxID=2559607 RepID=UPI00107338BF|nr:ABC transporter ATP-binding protein [Blastococcus sp. CT_GayMR16]TFV87154.1 ABC transporter ATP-binding protein [Blastococcus sp. CT_GayMR16]